MASISGIERDVDPEILRFKRHLAANEFLELSKIEDDLDKGRLKVKDILGCTEDELKTSLRQDYNVSIFQANRFVEAVKQYPESRMNRLSRSSTNSRMNQNRILSSEEQAIIDKFDRMGDFLGRTSNMIPRIRDANTSQINMAIEKVCKLVQL